MFTLTTGECTKMLQICTGLGGGGVCPDSITLGLSQPCVQMDALLGECGSHDRPCFFAFFSSRHTNTPPHPHPSKEPQLDVPAPL